MPTVVDVQTMLIILELILVIALIVLWNTGHKRVAIFLGSLGYLVCGFFFLAVHYNGYKSIRNKKLLWGPIVILGAIWMIVLVNLISYIYAGYSKLFAKGWIAGVIMIITVFLTCACTMLLSMENRWNPQKTYDYHLVCCSNLASGLIKWDTWRNRTLSDLGEMYYRALGIKREYNDAGTWYLLDADIKLLQILFMNTPYFPNVTTLSKEVALIELTDILPETGILYTNFDQIAEHHNFKTPQNIVERENIGKMYCMFLYLEANFKEKQTVRMIRRQRYMPFNYYREEEDSSSFESF